MSKELPPTNAPPDVFHLFNENRTFFFESDISSLPNPSFPMPGPPTTKSLPPKLHKSYSQPQLSLTGTILSLSGASPKPGQEKSALPPSPGDLHLSTAVMTSLTSKQSQFNGDHRSDSTISDGSGSVKDRYQTGPTYGSSKILKSFKTEFNLFGRSFKSQGQRKSVSNPTSPRRASSPDVGMAILEELHQKMDPEMRKLSLVKEEESRNIESAEIAGALACLDASDDKAKSQGSRVKEVAPPGVDRVDSSSFAQQEAKLPLTQKVMDWFTTPTTQVKVNRTEVNAMSPQSF